MSTITLPGEAPRLCRWPVPVGDGTVRECGDEARYQVGFIPDPMCARCRDVYLACDAKAEAMGANAEISSREIAEQLGGDAMLTVHRDRGEWLATVEYQGAPIDCSAATFAGAVRGALEELAIQRRRDPEKQLREALRDVLAHVVDLPEAQVCSEREARARALDRKIAADRAILVARKLIGERR